MGLSTGREKLDSMANTSRMTSYQRREQLIEIGRSLFAASSADGVEEIASTAKCRNHRLRTFRRRGLYAVVVDREMRALTDVLINAVRPAGASAKSWNAPRLRTHLRGGKRRRLPRRSPPRFASQTRPTRSIRCWNIAVRVEAFSPTRSSTSICRPKACRITRRCSSA